MNQLKRIDIPEKELRKLYLKEKLSSRQIAKKYNCEKNSILLRMKRFKITPRSKSETSKMIVRPIKYNISKDVLLDLYYNKKLSPYQIARKYGCSPSAIFHKMKKMYKIPLRGNREAINLTIERRSRNVARSVTKYPKNDFSENAIEKAYMIGFRLGDLNVKKNKYGQTIIIQTWTTKKVQLELLKKLFGRYGHIYFSEKNNGQIQFICNLNQSFDFLLKKEDNIEKWILNNDEHFASFLAGYIDAEGHFGVYNGFAEFSVGTYDRGIINLIYSKLLDLGIKGSKPKITVKKGYRDKRGVEWHGNIWRFRITRKGDLYKFICLIEKFIKHKKRCNDMIEAKNNIVRRV